jgi:hypothetical protein
VRGGGEWPVRLLTTERIQVQSSASPVGTPLSRESATLCDAPYHSAAQSRAVPCAVVEASVSIGKAWIILSDLGDIVQKFIHFRPFWIILALGARQSGPIMPAAHSEATKSECEEDEEWKPLRALRAPTPSFVVVKASRLPELRI